MTRHLCILTFILFFGSHPVAAFKPDAHVWVGQQVVNDLADDGKLSIWLNGRSVLIDVPADVRSAILENRAAYLYGNIGPDAAPDVVVGQTLMHPGNSNAQYWQANDWMEYLLQQAQLGPVHKAYVYGYLGHAASDVFAHTYVNQYAGDAFDLWDETRVERRHMALEGYISSKLPPLRNHQGDAIGTAADQLNLNGPVSLAVKQLFLEGDSVRQQYGSSAFGGHLAALMHYRNAIDELAEDPIWHAIDVAAAKIASQYWLNVTLTDSEASQIVNAAQPVLDTLNGDVVDFSQAVDDKLFNAVKKYEQLGYTSVVTAWNSYHDLAETLATQQYQIELKANEIATELAVQSCEIAHQAFLAPLGIHEFLIDRLPFSEDLKRAFKLSVDPLGLLSPSTAGKLLDPGGFFSKSEETPVKLKTITGNKAYFQSLIVDVMESKVEVSNRTGQSQRWYAEIQPVILAQLNSKMRLYSGVIEGISGDEIVTLYTSNYHHFGVSTGSDFFLCKTMLAVSNGVVPRLLKQKYELKHKYINTKRSAIDPVIDLRTELLKAADNAHYIKNAVIDFTQVLSTDVSPIQSYLRAWRSDIDEAMVAYVRATGQVVINTVISDESGNPLEPMEVWLSCHMGAVMGVNSAISSCEFKDALQDLIGLVDNVHRIAVSAAAPPELRPHINKLVNLKGSLETRLKQELASYLKQEVEDIIPDQVKEIVSLMSQPMTASRLNQEFTAANGVGVSKDLLLISNMSTRVDQEMHLSNGYLDPDKYAVVFNAIQLTKLALLDRAALTELAQRANAVGFSAPENIVASAFRNLDGNHQWMDLPPPLPSQQAPYHYYYASGQQITENPQSYASEEGLRLWYGPVRNSLFRSLFKGTIATGIEDPQSLGLPKILKSDFPFESCAVHPFPSSEADKTCTLIKILPALMMLIH